MRNPQPNSSLTMQALDALLTRSSVPKLSAPGPSEEMLQNIFLSAFRAADHAVLRPWRFLVIRGEARNRLGQLFVEAALTDNSELPADRQQKLREKPLRAPLILVSISNARDHEKVPAFEQDLSAAAATQNMLIAAHAQGIGAMWRTGSMAYHPVVMRGLGLAEHEKIIGFVYMGTIACSTKNLREPCVEEFFTEW